MNSLSHYNLVRKFIPIHRAMRIPDAKAAVENRRKIEQIPARNLTKVKNKMGVIAEARKKGITDKFASKVESCSEGIL